MSGIPAAARAGRSPDRAQPRGGGGGGGEAPGVDVLPAAMKFAVSLVSVR
jgi:hypothetical protein